MMEQAQDSRPPAPPARRLGTWLVRAVLVVGAILSSIAAAEPWAPPGDMRLRDDLLRLNDAGVTDLPLSSWPLSWGDIDRGLLTAETDMLSPELARVLHRVREGTRAESVADEWRARVRISAASNPRVVRSFENTPREEAELSAAIDWMGTALAVNLQVSAVASPFDGDEIRPDGTYIGLALGNWMLSAGWQERWWGPGWGGSLILSNNARPAPGIAVQRNSSTPFTTKWLRWIGPWSLTSFVNLLDDEREVDDALLFGLRVAMRPAPGLEIGLSRAAQWCGDGRPCDFSVFVDMLLGRDNQGVNVAADEEPGNQLAGIDIRWSLPRQIPLAVYMQWIGEDGRDSKAIPGSWLRQAGVELWGSVGGLSHRTHLEVSETTCREGGFGFADEKPNCAYDHSIYRTGFRYKERSLGHSVDGDGLSYSLGSTLVQSAGHSWNILLRYMEINRAGAPDPRHSISATPQDLADIQLTHYRDTPIGRFGLGLGYSRLDDSATGSSNNEAAAFIQWSIQ